MCFILEHQQPILIFTININLDSYRTGIDFFRFIKIFQLSIFLKSLDANCCKIPQRKWLFCFSCVNFFAQIKISIICFLNIFILDINIVDNCIECCMTAMIRPVCINHFNFSDSWISLFFILEVILQKLDICKIHSQAIFTSKCFQSCFIQINKTI